ncbi:MAG: hypothetical protein ABSF26_24830, partial [Thermoguttaceae bacterium]
ELADRSHDSAAEPAAAAADDELPGPDEAEFDLLGPEPAAPAAEPSERRPRRRRRRGGLDAKRTAGGRTDEDLPAEAPDEQEQAERDQDEQDRAGWSAEPGEHGPGDFDEGEGDDDDKSPRIGFRNIPTWEEAVGTIIAKNMESRARNPGGNRPRGNGRGRGGNRNRRRPPGR